MCKYISEQTENWKHTGDGGDKEDNSTKEEAGEPKSTSKLQSPSVLGKKLKSKSVNVVSILCMTCSRLWLGSRSLLMLKFESSFGVGTIRIICKIKTFTYVKKCTYYTPISTNFLSLMFMTRHRIIILQNISICVLYNFLCNFLEINKILKITFFLKI